MFAHFLTTTMTHDHDAGLHWWFMSSIIDIATLSETRLSGEDSLAEVGECYIFFSRGYPDNERRIHGVGVGLAVKTSILNKITATPVGISD